MHTPPSGHHSSSSAKVRGDRLQSFLSPRTIFLSAKEVICRTDLYSHRTLTLIDDAVRGQKRRNSPVPGRHLRELLLSPTG